jgi:TolB-like protein/predicted Ser/Thr protein kinase
VRCARTARPNSARYHPQVAPNWLARAVSAAVGAIGLKDDRTQTVSSSPAPCPDAPLPERIGRYRVERRLGRGGMGIVYAGRDERLDRPVALKLISADAPGEEERRRFAREARAAARVNHPHVCQVYEVDEHAGQPFIAMELLAGEPLSDRLAAGPVAPADAVAWTLQVLDALQALHAQSLVHRDLKPSNVFLGPHGVKVLDFGLAREVENAIDPAENPITRTGAVLGTPRYMAPEQVYGQEADARTDLFAAGAILFEMLAGRPAFPGRTAVEVLYATLHEHPPALAGSAIVVALDRVVRRALAKAPDDRFPSAEAMAADLRAVPAGDPGVVARAQALTRLIVLPFRVLRADPETDFLSLGLAEAIASSLSGCPPLVVRSSLLGQRFAGESLDLKRLAAEADVDRAITGTLLRSGGDLRVGAQLVEVPSGTVLWSHTATVPAGDVFGIQDDLAGRVLASVAPRDAGTPRSTRRDVPRTARAYEFYLRANEVGRDYTQLPVARDLYRECLEEDPGYAPAWARLGRALRVIGKYLGEPATNLAQAEDALARALALSPELGIAHKYSAHLEAESGRVGDALERLLARARVDRNDPEIFGALVHACRYAGLQRESLAAHARARVSRPAGGGARRDPVGGRTDLARRHAPHARADARAHRRPRSGRAPDVRRDAAPDERPRGSPAAGAGAGAARRARAGAHALRGVRGRRLLRCRRPARASLARVPARRAGPRTSGPPCGRAHRRAPAHLRGRRGSDAARGTAVAQPEVGRARSGGASSRRPR